MFKTTIITIFAASISIAGASAQSAGSYTRDQIRGFLASATDILILDEGALSSGSPSYVLEYSGVRVGLFLNCPKNNYQRCTGADLLILMPDSMRTNLAGLNGMNASTDYGRFYNFNNGALGFANGLLMTGLNGEGIRWNIKVMAAISAVLSSNSSSVSYEGGETSPGEKRIDASHQPSAILVASKQFETAADEFGDALAFSEAAIADAQSFGALRKIADEFLGD